jgi:creatinine amidohydrolase/Fe(II)-dependent formamide hydrolase-like protein
MKNDRRTFIKMVGIATGTLIGGGTKVLSAESATMNHLIEELRPKQIMDVVSKSSMVFIPVSPVFEWHSYHLPLATDGIIAEEVSRLLAIHFNGVYFRTLSVALEEWRKPEFLAMFGISDKIAVYGMDFPGLPVKGEYHKSGPAFLRDAVEARLTAVKNTGFKYAFLLNCHGGSGQQETLEKISEEWSGKDFKVVSIFPNRFNTYKPDKDHDLYLKAGAHAGLRETHFLMAFRPDLIDLKEIPAGDLKAAEYGIYHTNPTIPDALSPRHALESIAREVRKSILENGIKFIESCIKSGGTN